jgi:hypothetical protein
MVDATGEYFSALDNYIKRETHRALIMVSSKVYPSFFGEQKASELSLNPTTLDICYH